MRKKKTIVMWALWNYDRMMFVRFRRKDVRKCVDTEITFDPDRGARMLREGSLRITKVSVKEI